MKDNYLVYTALALSLAIGIGSLLSVDAIRISSPKYSDKFLHIVAYSLLALNWYMVFRKKDNRLKISILISLMVMIYGIIIEVLQEVLTNYREADIIDMLANFCGILLAFILFNTVLRKKIT